MIAMLLFVALVGFSERALALGECNVGGCAYGGSQYPMGTFSTSSPTFVTVSTLIYAGEWQQYSVVAGTTYEWSVCASDGGNAPYDSQLTLFINDFWLGWTQACYSDDYCVGSDAKISWTATFTGNVRLRVNQYNCASNTTPTTLVWRVVPPCESAINIPSVPVTGQSLVCNSANALNSANVSAACGAASNDYKNGREALYTFTPSVTGSYLISLNAQTWSSIFVYSGACPATGGTCVGSIGNSATSKSLTLTLTASVTYYIWFDTWPTPISPCPGTFSISLAAPNNDLCANAINITPGSGSATNVSATGTDLSSCAFNDFRDVWYRTTNTTAVPRRLTVSTSGSNFDPTLAVYSGTCAGLTELACNDDFSGSESQVVVDCIQPGQQVYIRLAGYNGAAGNTTLTLSSAPDPVAPTITCPANITVNAELGYCDAYVNYIPPWADSLVNVGNYTGGGIIYAPIAGTGTSVSLADDQLSGAINIGFPFNFYLNSYNNVYISSNGFLTFDPTADDGCCTGQLIPDATSPNNLIAFAWNDLNPELGGTIEYFTVGSAPNRRFIVNFTNIQHYPGGNPVTSQIQLHEGIGVIEIHTTNMPSDGSNHTMGLENASGNAATYVTERNSQIWSTSNEGIQFIPPNNTSDNCSAAYTEQIAGIGFSGFFPVGTTTETYRITDWAGNTSTCSFTVTVLDNQAPFVEECPSNINTVSDQPGCGGKVVNYSQEFGDNCHGYVSGSLVNGLASGSVFPIGTTNVQWSFDDGNGNPPATCSFNVTVEAPTTLSSALSLTDGCGTCDIGDGQIVQIYDQFGDVIMTVEDDLALPSALGSTQVCNLAAASPTALDELGDPVPVLERFWRVTPTVNGPATVTLHLTNDEYDDMRTHPSATGIYAINALEDLCFTKYASGTPPGYSSPGGVAVNVIGIVDNGDGTISAEISVPGFSDIYCHACSPFGGPLPVELVSFYGQTLPDRINELIWYTDSELGVSHFELERSDGDMEFSVIGQITALGNSTTRNSYRFMDEQVPEGGLYYRLRTVDDDGTFEYSRIIFLQRSSEAFAAWQLYPNPATDRVTVSLTAPRSRKATLRLIDALGRVHQEQILELSAGQQTTEISLEDLPEGLYQVELRSGQDLPSVKPLIRLRP